LTWRASTRPGLGRERELLLRTFSGLQQAVIDPKRGAVLDGPRPVVAEDQATLHPCDFSPDVIERFWTKYDWDITIPNERDGRRVLLEIPVVRWLLAGVAQ
jgi:hypothetical protein